MNTLEYELRQQFPSLDRNFKNEFILQPFNNNNMKDEQEFYICKQLCPYMIFIRRDFGDVYQNRDDDPLFENFTIYLESSDEYYINRQQSTCKRQLATHGIVYARLKLDTMVSTNTINEDLLVSKLWDMGNGLTCIAGQCTTSETQQATNYYTYDGHKYTAQDEALIHNIRKQSTLKSMLGLSKYATSVDIERSFNELENQLKDKWDHIKFGPSARSKLFACYERYFNERNSTI